MATTWFTTVRRFAGLAITLLFSLCWCGRAVGQGAAPLVTASSAVGMSHHSGWGVLLQTAIDANGDWLVVDFPNGALYEFPADGSAMKTLVASGGLGSANGYQNPAIALDASENLYLGGNWSNCLLMFPYDSGTNSWPGLSALTPDNPSSALCGKAPYGFAQYGLLDITPAPPVNYFQPFGLTAGPNNTLVVGDQGQGFIFTLAIVGSGSNAKAGAATDIINGLSKRPMSIAQDPTGNIYFVEDSGGLPGVYMVPAGSTGLKSDAAAMRVDPNLPSVTAVTTDPSGNLYISDSSVGVVMVPNPAGVPQTSEAILLTSVPAKGQIAIDWARNTMYVPTNQKQSNNQADVAKVNFGYAELGSSAVGTAGANGTNIIYSFQGSVTPYRFVVLEDGAAIPDFAITGGTCTTGTAYAAISSCMQTVTFEPTTVGGISAKLLMQKTDPLPAGSPDANEAITQWSYDASSKVVTLSTSNNGLVYGQLVQLSVPSTTDALHALDGQQFTVLYAGLNKQQFEIQASLDLGTGDPTSGKTAATLAVDASGAIYITSTSGTTRIPFINGALVPGNATAIAADVAGSSSLTIDRLGNVYLAGAAGGSVTEVLTSGTLVLLTPADLNSSTTATATITNSGNGPLVVTAYSNSRQDANPFNPNTVQVTNFTGNEGTCIGDSTSPSTGIAAGPTCTVDVMFQPGAGAEGMLTGQVFVASKAVNAPSLAINVAGEGLPLTSSGTAITVSTVAEVVNAPATITVASKSGTGAVPTGQVAISFQTWTVGPATSGANKGTPTIFPQMATVIADLDSNGKATIANLASPQTPVLAGSQTFNVEYIGDRVYGRSPGKQNIVVAKSAIEGIALPKIPDASDVNLPFTMADNGQGTTPYDGSFTPWQYQFIMNVQTTYGVPTGQITMMDDSTKCPAGTSPDGLGTAACVLQNYSGVACPQKQGAAVQPVANAGSTVGGALVGGQAKFDTGCLWSVPQGTTYSPVIYTHYIHPEFSGDDNFLPAKGDSTLFQAVRGPLVQITKANDATTLTTAPSLTVTAGSSASIDLTISSLLGYGFGGRNGQLNDSNFPVSLTCDMPGLPHAACAVTYDNSIVDPNQITAPNSIQIPCPANPTSTQLAAGSVLCSPGHATVTLYTNVAAGTTTSQNAKVAAVTLAGLFGLGMIGLFVRRRAFEKGRMLLMIFLIMVGGALAVSITACSTTNLSPQSQLTTKAGTYKMTITAQEVGTQCIPQSGAGSNCTINGQPGVLVYGTNNQVSLPFYVNVTVQ